MLTGLGQSQHLTLSPPGNSVVGELPVSECRMEQVAASNREGRMHWRVTVGVVTRILVRPLHWKEGSEEKTEWMPGWSQMQVGGTVTQCLALVTSPVCWETELSGCPAPAEISTCLQKKGVGKGKKNHQKNPTSRICIVRGCYYTLKRSVGMF